MSIKIVVNKCHGGFGLSEAAMFAYAERKGMTLYPEKDDAFGFVTYWTAPDDQRPREMSSKEWAAATTEQRVAYNEAHDLASINGRDIDRDDADLVAVVEALGDEASARFADLRVVEIPDGVAWKVEEYDGLEWIAEEHRTW